MWEWFSRYPSAQIEDVGTPYVKGVTPETVPAYDYIIVGGNLGYFLFVHANFQGALRVVF